MPEAATVTSFEPGGATRYSSLADGATVTIPGVEIVKAGKWKASTGPVEITTDDLAAAVAASKDPEVDKGPLRFGHTGGLSNLGDSTPAFGWLDNLSIAEDGETIVGDLTDVPAALAPAIKAAFKRRSAELAWGVKTVGGKAYSMVIDGLALLGVQAPAVKGLTDLAALYDPKAEPVTLATSKLAAESHSTLSFYDVASPADPTDAERIAACVRYAKQQAAELAALTGIAGLQAVFDALDAMVPADSRGLLAADPHAVPVPALANTSPGGTMPDTTLKPEDLAKARGLLGLADDATDEQVTTKLAELDALVTAGKPPVIEPPAPVAEDKVPAALSAETIKQLKDAGLTVVADAAFDELKRNAAAGAEAHSNLAGQARDSLLELAFRQGKLGAGEAATVLRTNLAAALERDFDGTKAVIDALPAIVPVGEIGSSATAAEHTALAAQDAALDAEIAQLFAGEIPTAKEA